ncbi:MAG: DUF3131 domain-containing protein [Novosphingobium sp.]|uniref:DUF3131 domain-containing protein n=1 Tax=Novosphingobium sp. TaxID=1874826 RepID=UPI003B9989EA
MKQRFGVFLSVGLALLSANCAASKAANIASSKMDSDPVVAGSVTSTPKEAGAAHPGRNGPLQPEERRLAEAAWRYIVNNTQAETGLVNAADSYPSTTMWDTASAIGAIVSAEGLGLITREEASSRLAPILDTLARIPLFRGICPNKAYNTITAQPVTYSNQPGEIGCSALDVGRALFWMRVVQQRHPELAGKAEAAVAHWKPGNLVRDGSLYGTAPKGEKEFEYLQEGRLGYEEYGAKAFRLWGFDAAKAARAEPYGLISLYGVRLPYDARDPRSTGAHNYVVTESYVLDGIEYGWDEHDDTSSGPFEHTSGWIARAAERIYEVQKRRFERTGILTARTEHQLAGAPYFVYDTVYSDGMPWATITDTGEVHPEASAVALKGAIGLWVLWQTDYTDRLFAAVKDAYDPAKGIYEGLLEKDGSRIAAFTANNNGIILESLLYKLEGKILRPTAASTPVSTISSATFRRPAAGAMPRVAAPVAAPSPVPSKQVEIAAEAPWPTLGDEAMGRVAWTYFVNNTQGTTGLVNAVDGYPSTTMWDAASGIGAVVAAEGLGLIGRDEAERRLRKALDTFGSIKLFAGLCPNKVYDTRTARPTNYSNQPAEIGCSAIDIGRMLIWLRIAGNRYPHLSEKIAEVVRYWKVSGLVRDGELYGVHRSGRQAPQFLQEGRLGYEEYSARGFALWGMDISRAAAPEPCEIVRVEGVPIMEDKRGGKGEEGINAVVTENHILDLIEVGGSDPSQPWHVAQWSRTQGNNIVLAQRKRFERTGILTARTEHQLDEAPNFVYDAVLSQGTAFATQDVNGKPVGKAAAIATKAAIGIAALWPDAYGNRLLAEVRELFDPKRGFFEGRLEAGELIRARTANTNGILLAILLYRRAGSILAWSLGTPQQ